MGLIARIFGGLFARAPKYHTSAYGDLRAAVVSCLKTAGLKVGGTAGYPRVEVHTITENQRLDKDGAVRSLSLTIESISDRSMVASSEMNEAAMEALTSEGALSLEGWDVLDVTPDQLQELPEASDSAKILYRVLQGYDVLVEKLKEDEAEPEPEVEQDPGNDSEENNLSTT